MRCGFRIPSARTIFSTVLPRSLWPGAPGGGQMARVLPTAPLLCKLSLYLRTCLLSFGVGLGEWFQVLLQIDIKAIDLAEPRHVTLE